MRLKVLVYIIEFPIYFPKVQPDNILNPRQIYICPLNLGLLAILMNLPYIQGSYSIIYEKTSLTIFSLI